MNEEQVKIVLEEFIKWYSIDKDAFKLMQKIIILAQNNTSAYLIAKDMLNRE
jgi:hypothetical protein